MSGNNAVAQRPKTVATVLESNAIKKRIDGLLGERSAQFCSTIVTISRQTHLAKAKPESIIGAAIIAATLDLPINPNLGFAHIVPYKGEAQFQMGYKGFIQLALRTGKYAVMNEFKVNKEAFISYNPITGVLDVDTEKLNEDADDIVGYGFYFKLVNGFEKMVYWSKDKCLAHAEKYSAQYRKYKSGLWKEKTDEMATKTVIKHGLSKYGILSVELQGALESDQAITHGVDDEVTDYGDNTDDHADPLDDMKPSVDIKEGPPASDEKKLIATLKIVKDKNPEQFSAACEELNIPVNDWEKSPAEFLQDLLAKFQG